MMASNRAMFSFLTLFLISPVVGAGTDSAEMGFRYPFDDRSESFVMITSAEVEEGRLTVALEEARGFKRYSMGFGFLGVMDGTEPRYNDSDAGHVTVMWKDGAGDVVGRATNATPQTPKRNRQHPAAEWKQVNEGTPVKLIWSVPVPKRAVQMEIVAVYTDTLTNTPSHAAKDRKRANSSGDMPLLFASFSGTLEDGSWKITTRPEDIEQTRKFSLGSHPNVGQIEATVDAVKGRLYERTGYKIIARPNHLDGISAPVEIGYRELIKRIDDSINSGEINGRLDTGFDVVPQEGE